jgi:hypothetical protein
LLPLSWLAFRYGVIVPASGCANWTVRSAREHKIRHSHSGSRRRSRGRELHLRGSPRRKTAAASLDGPDLVIQAIRDLVKRCRQAR